MSSSICTCDTPLTRTYPSWYDPLIEHDYQLHIRPDANRVVLNEVYALLGRVGLELVDPWEMETMMDDGTVVFYLTPEWDVWAEGEELHGTGETA